MRQTDLVALLRCSRYSLGIMASSRGLIAGRLILQVFWEAFILGYCYLLGQVWISLLELIYGINTYRIDAYGIST